MMQPYFETEFGSIYLGNALDVLKEMPDESVNCCVTSPPYWGLRDYGVDGQIGLEKSPEEYVAKLVEVFREVRRVLRNDGTLWLNLGDSYAGAGYSNHENTGGAQRGDGGKQSHCTTSGLKNKDLCGIPWRVAFALQADGWYLRSDIIWHKPNTMPESVTDRPTKSHEYLFLMSKSGKYYYDFNAIAEMCLWGESWRASDTHTAIGQGGKHGKTSIFKKRWENKTGIRNKRSVWTVATHPFSGAHFATFPPKLIEPCILAGCPKGGIVLDPFIGSGTTAIVAHRLDRKFVGIELSQKYLDEIAIPRIESETKQLKLFA